MISLQPPLSAWRASLYHELYVRLCRTLARPWLAGTAQHAAPVASGEQRTSSGWQLIDSRRDHGAIHATSLVDLRQTVLDLRCMSDDALDAEDASPAVALD